MGRLPHACVTRAACFDLDGCLVDSRVPICTAINHARVTVGLTAAPHDDLHRFIGPPLLESFLQMLADPDADEHAAPLTSPGRRARSAARRSVRG